MILELEKKQEYLVVNYEDLDGFREKVKITSFDWENRSRHYDRYVIGGRHIKSLHYEPNKDIYLVKLGKRTGRYHNYEVIEVEKQEFKSYCELVGFTHYKKRKKIWVEDKKYILKTLKNLRNEVIEKESMEAVDSLLEKVFNYENKL